MTLSIAKNAPVEPGTCSRFYYLENVYRPGGESHTFREISQMGLECIGAVDGAVTAEAVSLAMESLALTERDFVLELSHMGFVTGLFDAVGLPEKARERLLQCIRDKNAHELRKAAAAAGLSARGADALCRTAELSGPWEQVLAQAEPLALNARDGYVAVSGWEERTAERGVDFCRRLRDGGVSTVIYTDISRDGAEQGTNLPLYEQLVKIEGLSITASGGISGMEELRQLRDMGVDAAILGKALYTGRLDLETVLKEEGLC